jgi:hypothetical protein
MKKLTNEEVTIGNKPKRYKGNHLILEFTEFNLGRMNSDSAIMSLQVDDPQLSVNAFDKADNAIRDAIATLNGLMKSLSNSSGYRGLKSKLGLEQQRMQSLKLIRIVNSNNINYDIYISFFISDTEYWGVIKNILNPDPEFYSEVFKDTNLLQTKEWVIRTKGLVIKTIKAWLKVEKGTYKLINDHIFCNSEETGRMTKIEEGSEVQVVRSFDNKIIIRYNNDYYNLVNYNYIYFNFWFERINK